jgi:2-dehydropantoate 2-reductase
VSLWLNKAVKRIAIVGVGAVGGYYGAMLARAGNDVHFLLRSDYDHVARNGLQVFSPLGDFVLDPVNAHQTPETIGACDLVIIAIKATANDALPGVLPALLHETTALLALQNGLGNEEFLASHFGSERILGGKCFVCLNRIAPGVIRHIGHGIISIGEFGRPAQERTRELANRFRESGVSCQISDDIEEVLWRKLVWNIPFNGLAIAAGGKDVSQILADEELLPRAKILMREVIAIARASGVAIEDEYAAFQIARTIPMGDYKPSSLIDWQHQREVEVEPIWGEPLRAARELNVPAPELARLYDELRAAVIS